MKRPGLILATLVTILITGFVLTKAGWLQAAAAQPRQVRSADAHSHAKGRDPFNSDAAGRWRRCEPTHWRACLLQR